MYWTSFQCLKTLVLVDNNCCLHIKKYVIFITFCYNLLLLSTLFILSFWYRAINYDEKDPFLCNSCGFCKYAKFDYTLTAKACCAVDPIENEEDRKKVITAWLG